QADCRSQDPFDHDAAVMLRIDHQFGRAGGWRFWIVKLDGPEPHTVISARSRPGMEANSCRGVGSVCHSCRVTCDRLATAPKSPPVLRSPLARRQGDFLNFRSATIPGMKFDLPFPSAF